ncbi:hypothetical protein DFO61_2345 [Ectopseudomonas oleovorans]|uniref:Uncharacterized protein n=2 Tax=Ectopseudomonas oleovorans TaxID=301 RepID=A0A397NCW7_ECTOL|nr:hypothetical protein DFO61_2345 [Pseudomonas oleovorans]
MGLLALTSMSVLGEAHTPVDSITTATWEQYHTEYWPNPLCGEDELTLWSCEAGSRTYAFCSSREVTRTSGYMQYRASRHGKVEFTYPKQKKPPLGSFTYQSFGNGNASIEFSNGGYQYTLVDPLREASSILVAPPSGQGKQIEIPCGGNQTLQLNYTMRLMYDAGIWSDY